MPSSVYDMRNCYMQFCLFLFLKFLSSACFIFVETNTFFKFYLTSVLVHVSAVPFVSAKVIRVRVLYTVCTTLHMAGMFVQTSMHAWIKPQLPSVHKLLGSGHWSVPIKPDIYTPENAAVVTIIFFILYKNQPQNNSIL
jgi:hypothetical protein